LNKSLGGINVTIFTGAGTAVCTPFKGTGAFNYDAYEKLIRFQIENGTDAIVACGTTGEASTLEDSEHIRVVRAAVEIAKQAGLEAGRKVPVIAGAGGNNTQHCIDLGRELVKAGVDALMYVAPYYNKSSQRGIVEHYTMLAKANDVPIVIYNIPGRTSMNIKPVTFAELCKIPNIAAVKEATGDFAHVAEIIERCGDALDVYAGNDDYVIPMLSLGGKGVISTMGNIAPRVMHDMAAKYIGGDTEGGRKLQLAILGVVRAIFPDGYPNPMAIKTALNLMGFDMGQCRPPLTTLDEPVLNRLKEEMHKFGLIPAE
jgi:4-hydroxy-tetrahydrodipicolinate synthase